MNMGNRRSPATMLRGTVDAAVIAASSGKAGPRAREAILGDRTDPGESTGRHAAARATIKVASTVHQTVASTRQGAWELHFRLRSIDALPDYMG
jgi:hypothetical protein